LIVPPIDRQSTFAIACGFAAGVAIATVDNLASHGEVSPIVIVALLFLATLGCGWRWGRRGCAASTIAWASVPGAHLVKHLLGFPDTLHPNTYRSIILLAAFTLIVAVVGTLCGIVINTLQTEQR
jgi:hypothetical protein